MKNIIFIFALAFLLPACQTKAQQSFLLNAQEFKNQIQAEKELTLVDVRTPEEYSRGAIEGAVNWNFYEDNFYSNFDGVPKNQKIYIYCASGGRSGKAAQKLRSMGYKEVYDLKGGYRTWNNLK